LENIPIINQYSWKKGKTNLKEKRIQAQKQIPKRELKTTNGHVHDYGPSTCVVLIIFHDFIWMIFPNFWLGKNYFELYLGFF
jgi:hypothetical protein